MNNKVVIGAGFGDEGKGLFTDYLCRNCENPLIIRFSGGQQAGHTVVADGLHHVFSNFGSGTLQGAPSYFSRFCTIDPVGIMNELDILMDKVMSPKLFIDVRCPVTTPYDIRRNQHHHPQKAEDDDALKSLEYLFHAFLSGQLLIKWHLPIPLSTATLG